MSISQDVLKHNAQVWERLGPIAKGGTVFGLAVSPVAEVKRYWAATGCGVFMSDDEGQSWYQVLQGLSTPLLSTLAIAPNGALFAGALEGDLFASFNWGKDWESGIIPEELKGTITCLLPSPNFRNDGTCFAATDGGGVLVTRNSGKSWEDSSFGLGSSNVLALAAPPDWSPRETLFAATTEGVFMSLNGGRAWRETGLVLDDDIVDVLVVSPAFEQDHTLFAGSESSRLYCSRNGGRTWETLAVPWQEGSVNCLWVAPQFAESGRMVAGIGADLYVSADKGASWRLVATLPGSVLALAGNQDVVLAGAYDAGLFQSTDGGETWEDASEGLAARGFARLSAAGSKLYAMGPQEGLWSSSDEGQTWAQAPALAPFLPISAVSILPQGTLFVASQENGILRSTDDGLNWDIVCDVPAVQALLLVPATQVGWAGTGEGKLLATQDEGATWQAVASPCEGQEILTIAASPTFTQDHTVLMGTGIPATGNKPARVALWRSTDGGKAWRQITSQVTPARWVDIVMPQEVTQNAAEQAVLATGAYCLRPLRRAKDVWISTQVDPSGANTLSVVVLGEIDNGGVLYAATGTGVYRSIDGGRTWQRFVEGLDSQSFISIVAMPGAQGPTLYTLSLGGLLWKCRLV